MVAEKLRVKWHVRYMNDMILVHRDKNIVDDEYVYIRKNAFYNHIKDTKESHKLKTETLPS